MRAVIKITRGNGHGAITRLMSPSDLGRSLKPFVFLDIVDAHGSTLGDLGGMPVHPHSGIATVTVCAEGYMNYEDSVGGSGKIEYGGVEWLKAGSGVWHGKEMSMGDVSRLRAFQLWLALPPALENSQAEGRFIEAKDMAHTGPAYIIVGEYEGKKSPVPAPDGINYFLVTLQPGEKWTYHPPKGHEIGWLAVAKGYLETNVSAKPGDMVIFEKSEAAIELQAGEKEEAVFVLGSAIPHPHELHLGHYSVHTSAQALEAGERHISELGQKLKAAGDQRTEAGITPVYR